MGTTVFEQRLLEVLARKIEEDSGARPEIIDGALAFRWYGQPFRLEVSRG